MRKQTYSESASQPAPQPQISQHTHEVICKCGGCTVVIRCFGIEAAEREARWERRNGTDVEIKQVAA